jgi:uncharacterized protein YifE (UPF0438 family)
MFVSNRKAGENTTHAQQKFIILYSSSNTAREKIRRRWQGYVARIKLETGQRTIFFCKSE